MIAAAVMTTRIPTTSTNADVSGASLSVCLSALASLPFNDVMTSKVKLRLVPHSVNHKQYLLRVPSL